MKMLSLIVRSRSWRGNLTMPFQQLRPESSCAKTWRSALVSKGLAGKLRTRSRQFLLLLRVDLWICEVELLDCLDDRRGDNEPGEPLVVGRYHVPRRLFRRGGADGFFERVHVVVPELALMHVGC